MDELKNLLQLFRALDSKGPEILKEAAQGLEPVIEDLNTEQLEQGLRSDGSLLPNYSIVSVRVFGKKPGPMTLKDEGDFHRGIHAEVNDQGITMTGNDLKTDMLRLRYGDEIIGLTEESKQKFESDYLKEEFAGGVKKYFGKYI